MGATLLILANKQDIPSALSLAQIEEVGAAARAGGFSFNQPPRLSVGKARTPALMAHNASPSSSSRPAAGA